MTATPTNTSADDDNSWAVCLVTTSVGACLIRESVGLVPDPISSVCIGSLCRLLAAVRQFSRSNALKTTVLNVPICVWRSPSLKFIVFIVNSDNTPLPKLIADRMETDCPGVIQEAIDRAKDRAEAASAALSASTVAVEPDVATGAEFSVFVETIVRPILATYLKSNFLSPFAISSVIQAQRVGDGFSTALHSKDDLDSKHRMIVSQSNFALWNGIHDALRHADGDEIATLPATESVTVVVIRAARDGSAIVVFTTASLRPDVTGIRSLAPDLQSAIAEYTRIQKCNPAPTASRTTTPAQPHGHQTFYGRRRLSGRRRDDPDRHSLPLNDTVIPSTPSGCSDEIVLPSESMTRSQ